MKICVAGLWHLGVVTAACVAAAGHRVVAFDEDESVVAGLAEGVLPVDEPGARRARTTTTRGRIPALHRPARAGAARRGRGLDHVRHASRRRRSRRRRVRAREGASAHRGSRPEHRHPHLVAASGRVDSSSSSSRVRPGRSSPTRPRTCGSATPSRRSHSRTASSSESGPRATGANRGAARARSRAESNG